MRLHRSTARRLASFPACVCLLIHKWWICVNEMRRSSSQSSCHNHNDDVMVSKQTLPKATISQGGPNFSILWNLVFEQKQVIYMVVDIVTPKHNLSVSVCKLYYTLYSPTLGVKWIKLLQAHIYNHIYLHIRHYELITIKEI